LIVERKKISWQDPQIVIDGTSLFKPPAFLGEDFPY